jgi:hypothetical protein
MQYDLFTTAKFRCARAPPQPREYPAESYMLRTLVPLPLILFCEASVKTSATLQRGYKKQKTESAGKNTQKKAEDINTKKK